MAEDTTEDPTRTDGAEPAVIEPVEIRQAATIGCGVIGAAWTARMVLRGVEVKVFDLAPDAAEIVEEVLANARLAWAEVGIAVDDAGSYELVDSVAEAVAGAEFVQESVPERPEIKATVLNEIEAAVGTDVIIGSSTSGIRPSSMQESMTHPERLVVGHPFNPVYLLPLVEVVGGQHTPIEIIRKAQGIYAFLGMHPLHVRVEIDAFIADRLLEAVWREALWLVNDGVATTAEIDDAMIYGFGLRWAQMGLFETYRVAGGKGGFRHFVEQFGPTLAWPWTKLMDTPEFTPELVDKLVAQSDAQSGAYDVRELERIRDRNIAGFLNVLADNRWAAGNVIRRARGEASDVE